MCCLQLLLGLLKSLAPFNVRFVPLFTSALKLFDLRHALYTLRLFRARVFSLPALHLFAGATRVFDCLVKLVYGCSNLRVFLRGSTTHWPSTGHWRLALRCRHPPLAWGSIPSGP